MFSLLRKMRTDWRDASGRFDLINACLRLIPGSAGMDLRSRTLPRYFARAGQNLRIHEGVRIRGVRRIEAGDRVEIGTDSFLQASGGLRLGDDVILGPGVKIWTINHRLEDVVEPDNENDFDLEPVSIDNLVRIGANVIVLPGVHLPEGCVVTPGSVVGKGDYPPHSMLSGFPARVVYPRRTVKGTEPPAGTRPGAEVDSSDIAGAML